jgi:hypothetical protein
MGDGASRRDVATEAIGRTLRPDQCGPRRQTSRLVPHRQTTVSEMKPETFLIAHARLATHPIDLLLRTKDEPQMRAIRRGMQRGA